MSIKNLAAYFKERFPPINMLLFAIMFFTVYSVAVFFNPNINVSTANIISGIVAIISFFYRLRLFDEMKDYEIDAINHPHRVLQSGKISLMQLVVISLPLLAIEIIWSIMHGMQTILFWSIAVGYSLLMRYEFFIGPFLRKYLLLYSFTHMLIMPLIIIWIWSAYAPQLQTEPALLFLCLLSVLSGYAFELARKIHAPSGEKELVDSYSKSIGFKGSVVSVCICLFAGLISQFYLLALLNAQLWPYLLLAILYAVILVVYFNGIRNRLEKQFRLAEIFVSLFMMISYVSVIIEIQFG